MTTTVFHKTSDAANDKLDLLALLLFEDEKASSREGLDAMLGGTATRIEKGGDFKGKPREQILLFPQNGAKAQRVLLVGLGKRDKASLEGVRKSTAVVLQKATAVKAKTVGIVLDGSQVESALTGSDVAAAVAEAAILATYKFDRLKGKSEDDKSRNGAAKKDGASNDVAVHVYTKTKGAAEAIDLAIMGAEGSNLTRDLANEPANIATPTRVAEYAIEVGKKVGIKVSVLEKAEMKKLGMGSLLAVAQGSVEPPKLVIMEYEPKKKSDIKDTIAFVGKGVTFDSGGISIKPADKMWEMKFDKCGGCAVIGLMHSIARAQLPFRVIGLVPATENLPSGTATRPGDIVKAMSGKTIEILNTDAEGRLILADALAYSARYQPSVVIDLATLTGACVVALGDVRAGLFGNDEGLLQELKAAGDHTGEKVWPMPLDEEYGEHVKSEAADLKNLGRAGQAGSISAAYFLKHFAPAKTKWAHMDIAGTAWTSLGEKVYTGKGATGFGVRVCFEWLRRKAQSSSGKAPKKSAKKARTS
ncbi:MAG: leucyl aminopeptidase [Planctomycetota bacterium]